MLPINRVIRPILAIGLCLLLVVVKARALEPGPDDLFVRVIDVGSGLCCVVKMPGNRYMIYDAGNYADRGQSAISGILEVIPEGSNVDLLVLSHTDSDHLGAVQAICEAYAVKRVVRTGDVRTTRTWQTARAAIEEESEQGCDDIDLSATPVDPGTTFAFGKTFVTLISGFGSAPVDWQLRGESERRNAISVVVRIRYGSRSVLLAGDVVGRHISDPDEVCLAAERFMVENAWIVDLNSNVLVAPSHGSDRGSSTRFIESVGPSTVIFAAGHKHQFPRATTVQRYLDAGVAPSSIFRTDRGDNEGGQEWRSTAPNGEPDERGDDDVDIVIRPDGEILVEYRNP